MIYLFDGAMGTMLQDKGLRAGECPELWNKTNIDAVTDIHRQYVLAGSDIITANTFGANRIKLSHYGLSEQVEELNILGVKAARAACNNNTKIAGELGPTGKLIMPLGDLSFRLAVKVFEEQALALEKAGVDYIIIETVMDIQEMRAALVAAKSVTKKPVICSLTFGEDGRLITGTDPQTAAITLESLGADVIGANCSLGPDKLLPIIAEFSKNLSVPVIVQSNAGMPKLVDGKTVFPMDAAEMSTYVSKLIESGATYLGGCCGTTPLHIKAMRSEIDKLNYQPQAKPELIHTAVTSRLKTLFIGRGFKPVVIGERINPTGRKSMAAEIREGNFDTVKREALTQVEAGADILDINMGVPGVYEPELMHHVVSDIAMLVQVPLAIDTTNAEALEEGLKTYPGRALINSISAEEKRLEEFMPLAKKYGAAVLCLPLDDKGVPETAEGRVEAVRRIVKAGLEHGLKEKDFLLDALVMTVSAAPYAALETLNTLKLYRQEFGYPAMLGLSNVSFGLPRRNLLNASFLSMAMYAGLDAAIMNPFDEVVMDNWLAANALVGHDKQGIFYSQKYINSMADKRTVASVAEELDIISQIKKSVMVGEKSSVVPLVKKAIAEGHTVIEITEKALTAAMNQIGDDFGVGKAFLPQVMMAAETMKCAFDTIKEELPNHKTESIGKVVLATVKGDIHDLGKNIVGALLENSGFTVIDLGKDVECEEIIKAAQEHEADIVGLCALMTTTLPQMDIIMDALKKMGIKVKVIVGGAVVTDEYAKGIGADAYAGDGMTALNIAKQFVEKSR